MRRRQGKIFGIGLSRTGTTSLTGALKYLGFSAIHFPMNLSQIDAFDAATDTPVALQFKDLDRRYRGSAFVLTSREKGSWLNSCAKLWNKNSGEFSSISFLIDLHTKLYGSPTFDKNKFSHAYDTHERNVCAYFRDRPNKLLKLNVFDEEDPWQSLCNFLDISVPSIPFPHQNQSKSVDGLLRCLLTKLHSIDVAKFSGISLKYIQELHSCTATLEPTQFDGGYETVMIVKRLCDELGRANTARLLSLPMKEIDKALAGINDSGPGLASTSIK